MKKTAAILTAAALTAASSAAYADGVTVFVNNSRVVFNVNPVIEKDRTLAEFDALFQALGAEVQWDSETNTAVAYDIATDTAVTIQANNEIMFKNEEAVMLDSAAIIIDGKMMIPLRAAAESMGAEVSWDEATQTVSVVK